MRKVSSFTCVFLLLTVCVYSGPRNFVNRSITQPRASVHPFQVIIFASAEAEPGESFLSTQGQQRASYLVDFFLYQYPDGFTINQAVNPIRDIYVPGDPNNLDSPDVKQSLQTVAPLFHNANGVSIEQTKGKTLTMNQNYGLNQSPEVLKDMLFSGNANKFVGNTVIICWKLEQITTNFDGLFGDPEIQSYFQNALSELEGLGTERSNVWVIQWNQDTPVGQTIKQVGVDTFNVP